MLATTFQQEYWMVLVSSSLEKHKVLQFRGEAQASEIAQAVRQWTKRKRVCRGPAVQIWAEPQQVSFFFSTQQPNIQAASSRAVGCIEL